MITRAFLHRGSLVASILVLAACSSTHKLPQAPNIYTSTNHYPEENVAVSDKTTGVDLLYITDRNPVAEAGPITGYGEERSASMSAGVAQLRYGDDLTWAELVEISQVKDPKDSVPIHLEAVNEIERFPETPPPITITENGPVIEANFAKNYAQSKRIFQNVVRQRLKETAQKDVILYIHGFNNDFESALYALNDVWHYTGRHGVPVAYSWPSGAGGLFGYFADRESGEFTIYHLKESLRLLAAIDEVEQIHIIAHSRGTDVTTSALRELVIEARAGGKKPREVLKVENLILAAPDIDYGVVKQRLLAEQFGPAFGKITIYMNEEDGALGLSQWLMKGVRFGRLKADEQGAREDQIFQSVRNVSFISVTGVKGGVGHAYFRRHPGVLSDIVRVITTDSDPGSAGRPLLHMQSNFWRLDREYLDANQMN